MRSWLFFVLLASQLIMLNATGRAEPDISVAEGLTPGGIMIGRAPVGSSVNIDGQAIRVSNSGDFVFGVGRDAEGSVTVEIDRPDGSRTSRVVRITERDYDIQRIDGLPTRKVEPNEDDQAKIEADWIVLNDAKAIDSAEPGFAKAAVWPVLGPISGVFGSQRILNGKPKSPHRGVDVVAAVGTPVNSMLGGVVTVADSDMYYTGGTVMVDHGHGLQSLYAHLSSLSVDVGQRLHAGEKLGEIGATGRVTGPHLHLGLYWFKTAVDPALLLGPMPEATQ